MSKVAGVKVECVNLAVLDAAIARLAVSVRADADVKAKVAALAAHYRSATPKPRLAGCDGCGGVSDVTDAVCPYCGNGAEVEGGAPSVDPVASTQPAPQTSDDGVTRVPVQVVLTAQDLDVAVKRVQSLKSDSAGSLWELGAEIRRIYSFSIWKLRTDEKGAPAYKAWGPFCERELGISPTYAYKLMDVSEVYSREQVHALGAAKLHVTLQVPKEHRAKLLAAAKAGASVRELNAAATAVGKKPRDTGRSAGKGGGARAHGGRKAEKVTVAAILGRVEIPLCKGETDKPARSMADAPRGEERLLNGVKQVFTLTKDEAGGQWVLAVERVRE